MNEGENASYEDRLNLALVQRSLEKFESSNTTLKDMLTDYSNQYVISMWMCYNYLDIAYENADFQEVLSDLRFRYQDCCHIYEASGMQDEDMERLKEIMKNLGE